MSSVCEIHGRQCSSICFIRSVQLRTLRRPSGGHQQLLPWVACPFAIAKLDEGMTENVWVAKQIGRPAIKGFNTVLAYTLAEPGFPKGCPGRLAAAVAGNDQGNGLPHLPCIHRRPISPRTIVLQSIAEPRHSRTVWVRSLRYPGRRQPPAEGAVLERFRRRAHRYTRTVGPAR